MKVGGHASCASFARLLENGLYSFLATFQGGTSVGTAKRPISRPFHWLKMYFTPLVMTGAINETKFLSEHCVK